MNRREFLKSTFATGALYAGGGLPLLGRAARAANAFPPLTGRVLVNVMLKGGADMRHLFTPPYDPSPASYGYRYWEATAASHSIPESASAYESRWVNDYLQVDNGSVVFGILGKCGWLKRMWEAGNVAIIANAAGVRTRDHAYAQTVMNQGNLSSGPNDRNRSGWGGRLAYYTGGNVLSVTRSPSAYVFGPDLSNPEQHDNQNLISARNTRKFSLFSGEGLPHLNVSSRMSRSLRSYYSALNVEMPQDSIYRRFVEHDKSLRSFGEIVKTRLSGAPLPASISSLMTGELAAPHIGEQVRNLYDSFLCSDIFSQRVVSMEIDGWDTHRAQRDTIEPKLEDLFGDGKALDVLYREVDPGVMDEAIFVIGGEFGRQLRANGDNGTDHGHGTYLLVIGNGVQGGIYGTMFPEDELDRLGDSSPQITGLTTFDSIFTELCEWVQPGAGSLVFPDKNLSMVENGVDLTPLSLPAF